MAFQFRFESVLKHRQQLRDEAGARVAQAISAIDVVDKEIADLQSQARQLRVDAIDSRVGNVSVDGLLSTGRYELQLQAEVDSLRQTRGELTVELSQRKQLLAHAEAEVKKFERLKENQFESYQEALRIKEQKELDDVVTLRYIIQRQRESHDFQTH